MNNKDLTLLERRLKRIYSRAYKELKEKYDAYATKAEKKARLYTDKISTAKTPEERAAAIKEYQRFMSFDKYEKSAMQDMIQSVADEMANVNQTAIDYINGVMPKMYATAYNSAAQGISKKVSDLFNAKISFNLVNERAVRRLAATEPNATLLPPYRKLDLTKDKIWSKRKMNAEMLQGLLQGESVQKMSQRLKSVVGMEQAASIRNARTMATSVLNGANQEARQDATEKGVMIKKRWESVQQPGRTRETHLNPPPIGVSGEVVDVDKPFSNGLMYPGDPNGEPSEVYNCRCRAVDIIIGYNGKVLKQYQEMEYDVEHKSNGVETESKAVIVTELSKEMQSVIYDYTEGKYSEICDYSQYIVDKKSLWYDTEWFEKYRMQEISDTDKMYAEKILNIISNQPITYKPLFRIERGVNLAEVGDEITFGIRSATRDSDFPQKVFEGETEGFDFESKDFRGNWTEYRILSSRSLDVSPISAYVAQEEELIAGTFEVVKTETIESQERGIGFVTVFVKDVAESISHFTSKSGKEMVRYVYDGKEMTDTVDKFNSRTVERVEHRKGQFGRKIIWIKIKE